MNFYVASSKHCRAILFSKTDVQKFRQKYRDVLFVSVDDWHKALAMAKPKGETSPKCYAVKRGHVKGIFFTELVYNAMLVGYRDACGKKCLIQNAYHFIYGRNMPSNKETTKNSNTCAYVDGSFSACGTSGIGYRLYHNGEIFNNCSFFSLDNDKVGSMECEILSVMLVVRDAIALGIKELVIYCDNQTVVSCSDKILKKNLVYQNYIKFMKEVEPRISVRLHKVKGHSTSPDNNTIDKLVSTKRIDAVLNAALSG